MQNSKIKLRKYFVVFLPSSLSMVFCVFLSGAAIVLNQFESIKGFLELPRSFQLTRILASWADSLLTSTIGESRTETLVVGLFWAVVGLIVYMFLRSLARFAMELDDDLGARRLVWPRGTDRYLPLRQLAEQAVLRGVAVLLFLLVALGPLAAVVRGPILTGFLGPNKPLQYAVWFFAGILMWHILTVLMRLAALRARLFG